MTDTERLADGVRPSRETVYAHCAAGGTWIVAAKWPVMVADGDKYVVGRVTRVNAFDNPIACFALIRESGDDFVRAYALDADGHLCEPKGATT